MAIDPQMLSMTTNHIYSELLKARGLEANRQYAETLHHYRSAAAVACEMMRELTTDIKAVSKNVSERVNRNELGETIRANPELIRSFLKAEEDLLKGIGLDSALVQQVMDRCIDFTEQDPKTWDQRSVEDAFNAAKFRVCDSAPAILNTIAPAPTNNFSWRRIGRIALRAAIGVTIIGADYVLLGPGEILLFGLSTAYGVNWLPTMGS